MQMWCFQLHVACDTLYCTCTCTCRSAQHSPSDIHVHVHVHVHVRTCSQCDIVIMEVAFLLIMVPIIIRPSLFLYYDSVTLHNMYVHVHIQCICHMSSICSTCTCTVHIHMQPNMVHVPLNCVPVGLCVSLALPLSITTTLDRWEATNQHHSIEHQVQSIE